MSDKISKISLRYILAMVYNEFKKNFKKRYGDYIYFNYRSKQQESAFVKILFSEDMFFEVEEGGELIIKACLKEDSIFLERILFLQ